MMSGHDLIHPVAGVLVAATLALAPPAALACGWWGDGESDDEESVVIGADGNPVADEVSTDPAQMARLSTAYRQGDGVPRDLVLARRWAQRAADAGHAGAMNDLGQMLEVGFGGASDEAAAARWYGEAARLGVAGAQHSLAMMLLDGRGVEPDSADAEGWLRRSAQQGHASAASELSAMIWAGSVAARAADEGCFWWIVALRQGHQGAADRCLKAQPAPSDEALHAVRVQAEAWVPDKEDGIAVSWEGGS